MWMCREDHEAVKVDGGKAVKEEIKKSYPVKWDWFGALPPLTVLPYGNYRIQLQYEFLKSVARRTILKEGDKDV